jgi:hypothetical protein
MEAKLRCSYVDPRTKERCEKECAADSNRCTEHSPEGRKSSPGGGGSGGHHLLYAPEI